MKYEVRWTKPARKDLGKYEKGLRNKINEALRNLILYLNGAKTKKPDVKKLQGKFKGFMRLRVGEYRVIFQMRKNEFIILVIKVDKRGDVYK